jgi:hypothetical protein
MARALAHFQFFSGHYCAERDGYINGSSRGA